MSNSVWNNLITVPGYDAPERDRIANFNRVTPDYFKVMSHADPDRPRHQPSAIGSARRRSRSSTRRSRRSSSRARIRSARRSRSADRTARHHAARSSVSWPTRSTSACASRRRRRCMSAGHRRRRRRRWRASACASIGSANAFARHGAAGDPERAQGSGRRLQGVRRRRPRGGDPGAARLRRSPPSSVGWRCCSPRSASTASCPTPWRGAATRSASAWRSAPSRRA